MKMNKFSRNNFIKLAATIPLGLLFSYRTNITNNIPASTGSQPNFIIILLDTLSAKHLPIYGYPRNTSPNIQKFAEKAIVYHSHRSAGNFTTPSTASLFTSTYPWTHRAFSLSGLINPTIQPHNFFQHLDSRYNQNVYTQNIYADMLLYQFNRFFNNHQNLDSFSIVGTTLYNKFFNNDAIYGLKSYDQFLFIREEAHGSLFLSIINDIFQRTKYLHKARQYADIHPGELPRLSNTDIYFLIEEVMHGVGNIILDSTPPFLNYIHLMPPHEPYVPTRPFIGLFKDNWLPIEIKPHRLAPGVPQARLNERRQDYDEFIANLDSELGFLLDKIEASGLMENSYIIITSDHGELFERGVHGHSTPLMFEPVINIPLIISAPGQNKHQDIYTNTSNIDLLPTILHLVGQTIPDWSEGQILPGFGGKADSQRNIFAVEAKKNPANLPLSKATTVLIKDEFKLVHYLGYKHYDDEYELYHLKDDPHELNNIFHSYPYAMDLKMELNIQEELSNQPFLNTK